MNLKDAESLLIHNAQHASGTYFRLRLGEDPGVEAIKELREALRIIFQGYADKVAVPRSVAYSCAIILHFSSECLQNLDASDASEVLRTSVWELEQGAFDVLAGEIAYEWTVPVKPPTDLQR